MPFYLPPTTPPDLASVELKRMHTLQSEALPFGPRFLNTINPKNAAGRTIPGLPEDSIPDHHLERVKQHLMFIRAESNPPFSKAKPVPRRSFPIVLPVTNANRLNHSGVFTISKSGTAKPQLALTQPLPTLLQKENDSNVSAVSQAEHAMLTPFLSVMDKTQIPPSGDKHDYFSRLTLSKKDALAQNISAKNVANRGESSPDAASLKRFSQAVQALALGYQMTQKTRYADKAVSLLNHWFLNPASRMNPNLAQAQISPQAEGFASAVSSASNRLPESCELAELTTALEILDNAPGASPAFKAEMREWYATFLEWLKTGPMSRQEAKRSDGDRKEYQSQIAMIARYLGEQSEHPAAKK